jgi:proteasome accessory factor C
VTRAGDGPRPTVHAAREQVGRLLALVPYLHQRGEVRISEAAAALGVDAAQLDKDLRVLFMCGLPGGFPDDLINVDLDALEGEGIIRVDNADYLARPIRFGPSEAAALVVALRAIEQSASPETRDVVERTLAKLEGAGAASAAQQIHVSAEESAGVELLPVLQGAIDRGHQLEIAYYVPSRDEQSSRIVEPRAITRVGDATYLDAWCHTANGDRAFRVDRIVAVTELPDAVSERAAEPRDLSGGWFRGDGETVAVTLRLQPAAQWVPEYYPVTETRPGPDGTLDVVLDVASESWLHQLLFRVAPHASVISPQEFAESFTANARAALSLYQDPGVG